MQELFDAVSISTILGNVSSLLIAFIGVSLLFVGYGYIKRCLDGGSTYTRANRASDRWVDFYTREQGIRENHYTRESYRRH
jgi:hypothetical protein